jgi:hypothetical protein
MALDVFYVAAAIAVLAVGGGFAYAAWQIGCTLQLVRLSVLPAAQLTLKESEQALRDVRLNLIPQVESSLTAVRANLQRTEEVAHGVADSVNGANEFMGNAVQTVENGMQSLNNSVGGGIESLKHSVGDGVQSLKQNVAAPVTLRARSVFEGFKAGLRKLSEQRQAKSLIVTPEAARAESATVVEVQTTAAQEPVAAADRFGNLTPTNHTPLARL